jgi:D-cysteine desulfhydrase
MAGRGLRADIVALAAGTASTYAGLAIGASQATVPARVLGISVSWTQERLEDEVARLISETTTLLRLGAGRVPSWFDDRFIGPGYAVPSEQGVMAVLAAARAEGVVLDTTYTGKALGGLFALIREQTISTGSTVVFVHTGGIPELFIRDESMFTDSSSTTEILERASGLKLP